ncbi:hypothetical protein, partial [Mesorhizobium sp. M0643]|uniref:hypothetical protein n=1 Tax=Mesorhizobium sp. M0643 TaxID=2956978 RepID=UPI00333D3A0D
GEQLNQRLKFTTMTPPSASAPPSGAGLAIVKAGPHASSHARWRAALRPWHFPFASCCRLRSGDGATASPRRAANRLSWMQSIHDLLKRAVSARVELACQFSEVVAPRANMCQQIRFVYDP